MDGTGLGLCSMMDFGIDGVEISDFATTVMDGLSLMNNISNTA